MPPRTVLHLSPSVRLLGARQSLLQLVTHLDPERYRPLVALPFAEGDLVTELDRAGVSRETVRMGQWRKVKFWPRIPWDLWRLQRLGRRHGVSLVHCNEPHTVPYGLRTARALGTPCIAHVRLDNVTPRLIHNYSLDRCDHIVAVSRAVARQIAPHIPSPEERLTVIPNGVSLEGLRESAPEPGEARRALGLPEGATVVGQVGLITERKRCHLTVEAFARVAQAHPEAHLIFVGSPGKSDGDYAAALDRQVSESGLGDRIHLLGHRPEIAPAYAAMHLLCIPSVTEGFGRVIIEAAAFGVPSVGSAAGGIPEVIADGETGWLSTPDDTEALATALGEALEDQAGRVSRGEAARRRAREEFAIGRHVERVCGVFDRALSASGDGC